MSSKNCTCCYGHQEICMRCDETADNCQCRAADKELVPCWHCAGSGWEPAKKINPKKRGRTQP